MRTARWIGALAAGAVLAWAGPAQAQRGPTELLPLAPGPGARGQRVTRGSPYLPNEELPPPRSVPPPVPAPSLGCPATPPPTADGNGAPRPSFWRRCKDCLRRWFIGYPQEFEAPELGWSVQMHYERHVANGEAARMVLYHYDFVDCSPALNLRGRDRLAQLAPLLTHNPFPIVIERTPWDPALAEARRLAVLSELGAAPFAVPPERVVIGLPAANGLRGVEAEVINGNLMRQTRSYGVLGIGGSVGGGGVLGGGIGAGFGQGATTGTGSTGTSP
ncbi:MAG: hypothetical protein L0Z62_10700 [Gemmataceae bacterium]|nr:hypothetical protein [Gemmataceae bacterium]